MPTIKDFEQALRVQGGQHHATRKTMASLYIFTAALILKRGNDEPEMLLNKHLNWDCASSKVEARITFTLHNATQFMSDLCVELKLKPTRTRIPSTHHIRFNHSNVTDRISCNAHIYTISVKDSKEADACTDKLGSTEITIP